MDFCSKQRLYLLLAYRSRDPLYLPVCISFGCPTAYSQNGDQPARVSAERISIKHSIDWKYL